RLRRDGPAGRGIELSAVLAGLALTGGPAVAPALAAATLQAALGQTAVSPQVAALLQGITDAMLSTKRKALTALLLVLTLAAGALAWRAGPRPASGDGEAAKPEKKANPAL